MPPVRRDPRNDQIFPDRQHAGRVLATRLARYAHREDVLVLGLPRGGVPVAFEVALALAAPLDVFLVRKLGTPGQPELAMGAIASGEVRVLNEQVIDGLGITPDIVDAVATAELEELRRRDAVYREGRPRPVVHGRTVLLVDDGLATGSTMRAAVAAVRQLRPARIVVAVPVAAAEQATAAALGADEVVCTLVPESFHAVGQFYNDFAPTSDDEVVALLRAASPGA